MTDQHPITPSPELVEYWARLLARQTDVEVFTSAVRWGADEQLEMDAGWVALQTSNLMSADRLRAEMRPKARTLKSIALGMLGTIERSEQFIPEITDTIRRALEQLND